MANVGDAFLECLKNNAKENGDKYMLSAKDFSKFLVEQGITEEVQKKIYGELDKEVATGSIRFLADIELDEVKKLKKEGKEEEAGKVKKYVRIKLPEEGEQTIDLEAKKVTNSGFCKDGPSITYGKWHNEIVLKRSVDIDTVKKITEDFKEVFEL